MMMDTYGCPDAGFLSQRSQVRVLAGMLVLVHPVGCAPQKSLSSVDCAFWTCCGRLFLADLLFCGSQPRRLVSANFENASRILDFGSVRIFGHDGIVKDLFGHTWSIATLVEDVPLEEMDKRASESAKKLPWCITPDNPKGISRLRF